MINMLNQIRAPNRAAPFPKTMFHTMLIAGAGAFLGVTAKLLDAYTSNLGNIFSQTSVWIFLCTIIAILSNTPLRAAVNVFLFCISMLAAYYLTAKWTSSIYSMLFAYGWFVFSLFSPILGFCVWYAKGNGLIPMVISTGILFAMLMAAIILFGKIRTADIVFVILTGIVLFKK